jgi:asparagine synthase (glutamine-hydrolysing)
MCGIVGFWGKPSPANQLLALVTAATDRLAHRGPDDSGAWTDAAAGLVLGHRRLSIDDLSAGGHQPMRSAGDRWVVSYNGEIYNHLDLRRKLETEGHVREWRSGSDTETLVASIEAWGVEKTLRECIGMFAFAAWDCEARALWLARDRAGEKPLYYGWQGTTFMFGSELKALREHPDFVGEVDRRALALFVRHSYVPSPNSIYEGIFKLPAGSYACLRDGILSGPFVYWSLAAVADHGMRHPFRGDEEAAIAALDACMLRAVRRQMMADVPIGVLLSGGTDSALIASLMQAQGSSPTRTFTIGFGEPSFDESKQARAVAAHLGTDHTELRLSSQDALDLIPDLHEIYDEPFADSSQLPTSLVMRLARRSVVVALSGDAGDEFFGGYNRHVFAPSTWRRVAWMPMPMRRGLGSLLARLPAQAISRALSGLVPIAQPGEKLNKFGQRLDGSRDIDDFYLSLVSDWNGSPPLVKTEFAHETLLYQRDSWPTLPDPAARMMALDAMTYLPDDILVKVDRASMAASLETRAPFLDRDVMEFAWTLPMHMKIREGRGKWILRALLGKYLPSSLIDRPKMGFGIPLDQWLRGPLRDWAESLLDEARLEREGYFHPRPIREAWQQHLRGTGSYGSRLWPVLMFQSWLQNQEPIRSRHVAPAGADSIVIAGGVG